MNEKCAVFGTYNVGPEAARLTYYGLWALQHRGQENSGIVSTDGGMFYRHSAPGLVSSVYREEDLEQLPGVSAIGHNRYSTSGAADDAHAQPILQRSSGFAFAHNGNLPNTGKLVTFLNARAVTTNKLNDSEMMAEAISQYILEGATLEKAIMQAFPLFTGVFSAVAINTDQLIAFRDQCGIRPLSIGKLGDGYVIASETCAFDTVGARFLRDVRPGELVVIDQRGITSHQVVKANPKLDIFELVYFARPDSVIAGMNVNQVRQNFGKELARQYPISADIVVPVPDSAIPAAIGYAQASGIPFEMGLIKNRYIHRTFIRPSQSLREQDVKMKLNPIPHLLKDKRIILIDDSIVRGTTTHKIAELMYGAGARAVHLLISSPPVKYPDFYGINLPTSSDLIAANLSVSEIRKRIGVDSLGYLSYDGMIRATGRPASRFSTSCFNGIYPIQIGKQVTLHKTIKRVRQRVLA
ncbi:MAG TPA: amidophosphoribosyltransferase [Candidatus Saccharimonadales bacterium]|nr:amidophosphoribosyltransferase [Candidatus Saccharimonadales bacterium]